ncbi:MAG: hypothetical protein AB1805_14390 [Nitrospirota bacterium]
MDLKELRQKKRAELKYSRIRLHIDILEKFKYLSVELARSSHDLMTEAAEDLLKKYGKKK